MPRARREHAEGGQWHPQSPGRARTHAHQVVVLLEVLVLDQVAPQLDLPQDALGISEVLEDMGDALDGHLQQGQRQGRAERQQARAQREARCSEGEGQGGEERGSGAPGGHSCVRARAGQGAGQCAGAGSRARLLREGARAPWLPSSLPLTFLPVRESTPEATRP